MKLRPVEHKLQSATRQLTFYNFKSPNIYNCFVFRIFGMEVRRRMPVEKHPDQGRVSSGIPGAVYLIPFPGTTAYFITAKCRSKTKAVESFIRSITAKLAQSTKLKS